MRKWLVLAIPLILTLSRGPILLTDLASNIASQALLSHLKLVLPTFELPDCVRRSSLPAARSVLTWDVQDREQGQEIAHKRGWVAWLEGRCSEAERDWSQACAGQSSPAGALSCLQISLLTQGRMGGIPESSMPPALLSDYASDSGRWAEHAGFEAAAAFSYELSLELAPNSFAAGKVTRSLLLEQQVEQAISVWDQMAVDLPREDPGHWLAVAEAAELEQDWEQVAIAYGRGAQIAEAPYRFWVAQGRALQHLDDWEDARQAYGRAFLLDVPRISPLKALGELGLQQDRYLEAARWFWMALQLRPDDVLSNYHMAQVLHGVGEHRSAVPFLARAVELHSGQPWEWLVELGDWQMALGDSAGALEAYHRALNWQPEETSIEERIEQVTGEGNQ